VYESGVHFARRRDHAKIIHLPARRDSRHRPRSRRLVSRGVGYAKLDIPRYPSGGAHSNTIEAIIASIIDDPVNSWFWDPNN
jgi:hypothetical protein